jgi:hypothetical protein
LNEHSDRHDRAEVAIEELKVALETIKNTLEEIKATLKSDVKTLIKEEIDKPLCEFPSLGISLSHDGAENEDMDDDDLAHFDEMRLFYEGSSKYKKLGAFAIPPN